MADTAERVPSAGRSFGGLYRRALTPSWLQWDSSANHDLTWTQNIIFGCVAAFSVANLYYTHPILNVLADDFGVSDERSSLVPTIMQAGYAGGLLFVIPIGDIVRRRPMIIGLIFSTSMLWLGLTLTNSFSVFLGLSFVVGVLTVTPQLMFPLVVQYAPRRHRATMISIVMSGIVFGMLIARLLSGIVTQYSSWRSVYWMSFGLQVALLGLLYIFMPDYPILRPDTSYPRSLLTIIKLPFRHPVLTQCSFIAFFTMAMFTSFWTTLTFQLAGPPFNLTTLAIGLFALIGISPVFLNPVISRVLTSRLHPSGTLLIGVLASLFSVIIGTFTGTFSLAGPIIWAFLGDLGMNTIIVANRMAFAAVDPKAQNAVNSVYMVLTFCGQLFGTAVGNNLYAQGGWVRSGGFSIGMMGAALLLVLIRGPHEKGWIGWGGGWDLTDKTVEEKAQERPGQDLEPNLPQSSTEDEKPNHTAMGEGSSGESTAPKDRS
ncbi:hypothetical protein JX266_005311 [Neoarthrinium moseri]|nr:hypothetical protein JX266_005311 [Neoarthrinium moseri]